MDTEPQKENQLANKYSTLFSLEGRVVVVTGASEGIGRDLAIGFADAGAELIICSRRKQKLEETRAEIEKHGGRAELFLLDVRDSKTIERLKELITQQFGKIDVLVNNAGVSGMMASIENVDETFFDNLFDTHVKGAFFAAQAVVPGMKARKFGRIINTGSTFAMTGSPAMSHYTGAKGALTAFSRAWARELAPFKITVNTVSPGFTDTPMTRADATPEIFKEIVEGMALKRQVLPEEISYAVAWLASREADAVTGQNISPNCGQAIVGI
jgi:3-oxoacyl-[acyl-carrier protein] reductase